MLYERKIRYLDYLSNGERVQGGGFVKLEVKSGSLRMELNVMGLYRMDSLERDVMLCSVGREQPIGRISISNGRGQYQQTWHDLDDIGGTGIRYEELQGIRVPLGAGREVCGRWEQRRGNGRENIQGNVRGEVGGEKTVNQAETWDGRGGLYQKKEEMINGDKGLMPDREGGNRAEPRIEEPAEEGGEQPEAKKREPMGEESERLSGKERVEVKKMPDRAMQESSGNGIKGEAGVAMQELPDNEIGEASEGDMLGLSGKGSRKAFGKEASEASKGGSRGTSSQTLSRTSSRGASELSGRIPRDSPGRRTIGSAERRSAEETRREPERDFGGKQKDAAGKPIRLLDDKWQQLCAIYPHIRPFQDEREYLSISPADFVLFPSDSYKMVNNSFLLHGYYNYNHLLLARLEKKGETCYYIGAPGNYFEKEKQVAIMFGFESFECAEEPAQPGDFGYYMMRVQL